MVRKMGLLMREEKINTASPQVPLYPLRFGPIYQYRLWGGRRLAELLTTPLSTDLSARRGYLATAMTMPAGYLDIIL
jgi:hypothetical protein